MMTAFTVLEQIWTLAGCEPAALERVTLTGDDPMLPTDVRIGTAASAVIAATALAATEVWRAGDGLGRVSGRHIADQTPADVGDLLAECDSPFGRLRHVVPAARLSETPAGWSRPAVPLGTHEPAWLA